MKTPGRPARRFQNQTEQLVAHDICLYIHETSGMAPLSDQDCVVWTPILFTERRRNAGLMHAVEKPVNVCVLKKPGASSTYTVQVDSVPPEQQLGTSTDKRLIQYMVDGEMPEHTTLMM